MRHYIYKKIGVTAVAMATMLTACSSDQEPERGGGARRVPIVVSTTVSEPGVGRSRAAAGYIEGTAFTEGSIGLYIHSADGSLSEALTVDGGNAGGTIATGLYWPAAAAVDFAAYYPQGGRGISAVSANDGMLSAIAFTIETAAEDQVDLLVSEKPTYTLSQTGRHGPDDYDGIAPLTFHHALAQIRFYVLMDVAKDGAWYDYDAEKPVDMRLSVALGGLYQSGTLTIGDNAAANDWGGHSWGNQNGTTTVSAGDVSWFPVDVSDFDPDAFSPADYTLSREEKMLVIPGTYQSLPTMTLTISDARDITDQNIDATLSAPLIANDGGRLTLRPGYIYNYYFVVELGKTLDGYFLTTKEAEQW